MVFVTSVMRTHQILLARVEEALTPFGLSFARYEVLMLLSFSRTGRLPLGKIGQRLQVHPASVTNVIDRLEANGLVKRLAHPEDGRATLAAITRPGRQIARRASHVLNEVVFADPSLGTPGARRAIDMLTDLRHQAGDFD